MGKGTLYTSKKQANKSTGARLAWRFFEKDYESYSGEEGKIHSIQFDFACQEWYAKIENRFGEITHEYATKAEIANFK